jgi:hypothetical protein
MSIFNLPPMVADRSQPIPPAIVTAEDGGLGLAHLDKFSLHMWCYDDGVLEWTHQRVIDLSMHIPVGDPMIAPQVAGSVEGTRTIFVVTDLGTYMIDLNSLSSRKEDEILKPLSQKLCSMVGETVIFHIFPYFSFFNRPGMYHLKILAFAPIYSSFCSVLHFNCQASFVSECTLFLILLPGYLTSVDWRRCCPYSEKQTPPEDQPKGTCDCEPKVAYLGRKGQSKLGLASNEQ